MLTTAQTVQPPTATDRLKAGEYVGYALGDTASNFFCQSFNIFLTYYYVDVWGIPATALANFTGAFVGMACQDLAGTARSADFDFFEYSERPFRVNPFCP